jgi:secreted trypsin-like serine protease
LEIIMTNAGFVGRGSALCLALALVAFSPAAKAGTTEEFIIGGMAASEGEWPWQVRLFEDFDPQTGFCGGSLIAEQWVLTAGHCVEIDGVTVDSVVVGYGSILQSKLKRIGSEKIILHPDYNTENHADLALIKLAEPISGAKWIGIADPDAEAKLVTPGSKLFVTGWGALWDFAGFEEALYSRRGISEVDTRKLLSANGLVSPEQLHEVEIELIPIEECAAAYKAYGEAIQENMEISPTEMCAGSPAGAKDSCYGDSGGPLVAPADNSNGYIQVGVVSWGSQCGNPVLPGVYNTLSRFYPWVREQMSQN